MKAAPLDPRSCDILSAVIHTYVMTAQPVGSRTIARRFNFNLSAATIRNVMADLEEMGYLTQPHTSAGRIPTDQGYRYFVDRLMEARRLSRGEEKAIADAIDTHRDDLDALLDDTSRLLSGISSLAALVLGPDLERTKLRRLEVVHVMGRRVLVVIIALSGVVAERLVVLPDEATPEDLRRAARLVNEHFAGWETRRIRKGLDDLLEGDTHPLDGETRRLALLARDILSAEALEQHQSVQLRIGGRSKIIEQPEFSDVERARALVRAFEDKQQLATLLEAADDEGDAGPSGVHVAIGVDSDPDVTDLSVVACRYFSGSRRIGTLGVVGPTRMDYSRIVTIVGFTSRVLSDVLTARDTTKV